MSDVDELPDDEGNDEYDQLMVMYEAAEADLDASRSNVRLLEADIAALTAERDRLREALGELAERPCAFDGSYAHCWEAIEADDIDAGEDIPCARCIARKALETP